MKTNNLTNYFFIFCILCLTSSYANKKNKYPTKSLDRTSFVEGAKMFYGEVIKETLLRPNLEKKMVRSEVRNLPDGLSFDTTNAILQGIVGAPKNINYEEYNFSYTYYYEDETTDSFGIDIFVGYPLIKEFQLVSLKNPKNQNTLNNNDIINYVENRDVAIVADLAVISTFFSSDPRDSFAVDFFINGNYFKRENISPYALNGDINGVFNRLSLKEGTYTIAAKVFSKPLNRYVSEFDLIKATIIDPTNQTPVIEGIEGRFPRFWGSTVALQVIANNPTETDLTYTADGLPEGLLLDPQTGRITGAFDLNNYKEGKTFGETTITVSNETPYRATTTFKINLELPVINSISLINAQTDLPVSGKEYIPFNSFNFADLSIDITSTLQSINITANSNIDSVVGGSIDFKVDDMFFRRERQAPYALAGDLSGNYLNWNYPEDEIQMNRHQFINVTIQLRKSKSLEAIGPLMRLEVFLVINKKDLNVDKLMRNLTISPNPATNYIEVNNLTSDRELGLIYQIYSLSTGEQLFYGFVNSENNRVDISNLAKGYYSIELITPHSLIIPKTKFLKQ